MKLIHFRSKQKRKSSNKYKIIKYMGDSGVNKCSTVLYYFQNVPHLFLHLASHLLFLYFPHSPQRCRSFFSLYLLQTAHRLYPRFFINNLLFISIQRCIWILFYIDLFILHITGNSFLLLYTLLHSFHLLSQ